MNAKQLKTSLLKALVNGIKVLVAGASGVGKTQCVEQVTTEAKVALIKSHPVVSDVCDYKGQPWVIEVNGEHKAVHLPYGDIEKILHCDEQTIVFIDDLGQSPPSVQAALMQFLHGGELNGVKIPECVLFWAATNRRKDRCGVSGILECVKSRFHTIVELSPDLQSWVEWAYTAGIRPEVIGWVQFQPEFFNSEETTTEIQNRPCPRTVEYASDLIKAGMTSIEELSGAVGPAAGPALAAFVTMWDQLPDLDEIRKSPDTAPVPTEPSTLHAVITALVSQMTPKDSDALWTYALRLRKEFSVLMGINIIHRNKANGKKTKGAKFAQWCSSHPDVFFE